jgi:hypothetical protein
MAVSIRYDEHAEFQIARRDIAIPGRHVMLRVVTPERDTGFVITAYFDRTKPCA